MRPLEALARHQARLEAEGLAAPQGFAVARIAVCLSLDPSGALAAVEDLRTGAQRRPARILAPAAPKRAKGVAAGAFWDKASYVLGYWPPNHGKSPERVRLEHEAFLDRHRRLVEGAEDWGLVALWRFLERWEPAHAKFQPGLADLFDGNICFRLHGDAGYLHQRPAARTALAAERHHDLASWSPCAITGVPGPVARTHPLIKGVAGSLSTGASLVSGSLPVANSYGKSQGANAQISQATAEAYGAALNTLLGGGLDAAAARPAAMRLGADTLVFWPECRRAEARVRDILEPGWRGEGAGGSEPIVAGPALGESGPLDPAVPVHLLLLSPNAGRLAVRAFITVPLRVLGARLEALHRALEMHPGRPARAPLWMLVREFAPNQDPAECPPQIVGEFLRAVFEGAPLPAAALVCLMTRIRSDRRLTGLRAALLRACLAGPRPGRSDLAPPPAALDPQEVRCAYVLGRLFAVLDAAQGWQVGWLAGGFQHGYLAQAAARPAQTFPQLLKAAQQRLKAARQAGRGARALRLEQALGALTHRLPPGTPYPQGLDLEGQALFFVGCYQQAEALKIPGRRGAGSQQLPDGA